jgi:KaiC/GvpD/RAD55 family RecA-like ATPase
MRNSAEINIKKAPKDINELVMAGGRIDLDNAVEMPLPVESRSPISARGTQPSPNEPVSIDLVEIGDALDQAMVRATRRATGLEVPIETPWPTINEVLGGGLWGGTMNVLVSGTGAGKSQWSVQVVVHAAKNGIPCVYVALELSVPEMGARILGAQMDMRWSDIALGRFGNRLRPSDKEARAKALVDFKRGAKVAKAELERLPVVIQQGQPHEWSAAHFAELVRTVRARWPEKVDEAGLSIPGSQPILIVLDYLQLVGGGGRDDLRAAISKVSYVLREAARRDNITVLVVSSTARENYDKLSGENANDGKRAKTQKGPPFGKGNPAAFVGLGKESGDIEYAADSVMLLGRRDYSEESQSFDHLDFAIAKLRTGPGKWVRLKSNGTSFAEASPGESLGQGSYFAKASAKSKSSSGGPKAKWDRAQKRAAAMADDDD